MYWSKREPLYNLAFHIKPVLAEDVDIPTDNMVFIPSKGNRMLDYIQSIGRVGRVSKDSP
jgi:predicted helicase